MGSKLAFWLCLGLGPRRRFSLIKFFLLLGELLLRPAALPTILPVADKEVEAERINLHAWLEANAEIAIVHLVVVDIGMKETQVAGDGKQKVVVVRRELRQFVL